MILIKAVYKARNGLILRCDNYLECIQATYEEDPKDPKDNVYGRGFNCYGIYERNPIDWSFDKWINVYLLDIS